MELSIPILLLTLKQWLSSKKSNSIFGKAIDIVRNATDIVSKPIYIAVKLLTSSRNVLIPLEKLLTWS